jgi:polar amino acid transport system substrate-binding protein
MRTSIRGTSFVVLSILIAACSGTASPSPSSAPSVAASPSASPSTVVASASPSPTADACAAANLTTIAAGKLTIGADNPAYPPYYQPNADGTKMAPWELGQPANGMGLESATAYAVAGKLGFAKDAVVWKALKFDNAIKPGAKDVDLYVSQVSYSAERAAVVDLSDGYFDLNQAVVSVKSNPIAQVTTVAGLKDFRLGTQVGTTSYSYITDQIKPTKAPRAYDSLDAAISGLKAKQIDGIVADLPTTFYMRDAQLDNGVIVGSLPTVGTPEHFSILLAKGSPLTTCVNQALAALKSDGTLPGIVQTWITQQGAPELK